MVSERQQRTYAAAVTNDGDSGEETSPEEESPTIPVAPQQNSSGDDFRNPLYLHITENASSMLVSSPLTEENYSSWRRSMKMALEVKNKYGLVDGSIPCPPSDDPQFFNWKRCNTMVCSWILRSISPSIAESVLYQEVARAIWKDLEDRFSQSDPHRIAELQNEIYNTKQGNMTVNAFFSKCKSLWEQMTMLRPLPFCECNPRCSCDLVSKIKKEREDDCVIRFLEGLNEEYETVKSSVLVADPVPSIEKVFKMALKLERKLNLSVNRNNNEVMQANVTQGMNSQDEDKENVIAATGYNGSNNNSEKRKAGNGSKNIAKCTYCGRTGHTIDRCYKKHGFPSGWIHGYKTKAKQNGEGQQAASGSINQVGDTGLSAEQFQKLVSLLQNQSGQCSSSTAATAFSKPGLRTEFKENADPNTGSQWDDDWFC